MVSKLGEDAEVDGIWDIGLAEGDGLYAWEISSRREQGSRARMTPRV